MTAGEAAVGRAQGRMFRGGRSRRGSAESGGGDEQRPFATEAVGVRGVAGRIPVTAGNGAAGWAQRRSLGASASLAILGVGAGEICVSHSAGVPVKTGDAGNTRVGSGPRFHRRMTTIIGDGRMPCPPPPGNAGRKPQGVVG